MEHSLLHTVVLWCLVVATGGAILVLFLLSPGNQPITSTLRSSIAKWVFIAACCAAIATFVDLFSEVAEFRGTSLLGGAPASEVFRFATQTMTGRLLAVRVAVLLTIACFALKQDEGRAKWWLIGFLSSITIVLTALVSHAAAQASGRQFAVLIQIGHIAAASVWLGVLFHLVVARQDIQNVQSKADLDVLAKLIRNFSPLAITVISLLLLSGLTAAIRFVSSTRALVTSSYGLTLLVKLALLVPAFFAGLVNHNIIRPQLSAIDGSNKKLRKSVLARFGRMLELEVTSGILLLAVAGTLASISPPGQNRSLQLNQQQVTALTSPRIPSFNVPDPVGFYGKPERSVADLQYAEFTHHGSGIVVILLGLCWLGQSARGTLGLWCGRIWPMLLVPFALFVAVVADPEVWWFRQVPLWQAATDPQLAEHQLGAVMVLILAFLGWRDRHRPVIERPLGYGLPVILIFGGLLLLGHAHSTLTADNALSNLISVQHAIFGAFVLLAGTVRWFSLRGLFPDRIARWIWPVLIIGLGLFMTFCYREITT